MTSFSIWIRSKKWQPERYFFWIAFLFHIIVAASIHPTLLIRAEMWAEMGSNYFARAHFSNIWDNLVSTDAGYLATLPRLSAIAVESVFRFFSVSLRWVPFAYQTLAMLTIAACGASPNFHIFRGWIKDDRYRFLISLFLAWIVDYEMHTFINATYFLAIPLLLMVFVWSKESSLKNFRTFEVFALSVALALAILSKGIFVCLLCPFLCLLIRDKLRGELDRKHLMLLLLPLVATLLQIYTMATHQSEIEHHRFQFSALIIGSLGWLLHIFQQYTQYTVGPLALLTLVVLCFRRKVWPRLCLPELLLVLSVIIPIFSLVLKVYQSKGPELLNFQPPGGSRHWFIPELAIVLYIAKIAYESSSNLCVKSGLQNRNLLWVGLVLMLPFASNFFRIQTLPLSMPSEAVAHSNWQRDYEVIQSLPANSGKKFCIPLNPAPWEFGDLCEKQWPQINAEQ